MMFFCLFLLIFFYFFQLIHTNSINLSIDDDIFYDETYYKKNYLNKSSDKTSYTEINNNHSPNIKNLNDYFTNNKIDFLKPTQILTKQKGKCLNFFNLQNLFSEKKNSEISKNLQTISNFLNDMSYIFKDEFGNFLIFSVCKNSFFFSNSSSSGNESQIRCFQKLIFVSKIDFSFYAFSFSGEKLPSLTGFSLDFVIDEFTHNKVK